MIPVATGQLNAATENYKKPHFKIEYIDSPYGVDTLGYSVEYYNDPTNQSSHAFDVANRAMKGKDNIMSYNWELGAPPNVNNTNYFKCRYYGYFYAEFTGTYSFFVSKEPSDYARLYIDTTQAVSPTDTGSYATILIDEWGYHGNTTFKGVETVSGDVSLTAGSWYPMLIDFAEREKGAYLVVRYREPDGAQDANGNYSDYDTNAVGHNDPVEHRKILSAQVFTNKDSWTSASDAGYLTAYTVSSARSAELQLESNQSNTFQFEVPVLDSVMGTGGQNGFRYDRDIGFYRDASAGVILRQNRLVRFYTGYAEDINNPSDSDLVQRFEGVVTDIDINKSPGQTSLKIKCQDLLYYAITQINENYPDVTSYVANDYVVNNNANEPAGLTRPRTYDAWPIEAVFRDLAVKAGIDPSKLYGRNQYLSARPGNISQTTSVVTTTGTGDYKIESRNITLRRRPKYGNPAFAGQVADDEYIWSFNFGDTIFDMMSKLGDTYGFDINIDNTGDLRFASVGAPFTLTGGHHAYSYGGTPWSIEKDIGSDAGKYYTTNQRDAELVVTATGAEFAVNFIRQIAGDQWVLNSSWGIIEDELPSGIIWDPNSTDYRYDPLRPILMYGVTSTKFPAVEPFYETHSYWTTTVYLRPTRNLSISELHIGYNAGDDPESFPEGDDKNVAVDIYMGEVQGGEYEHLVASSLILADYTRPNIIGDRVIRLTADDGLDTTYELTAGTIYGLRFVSKERGGATPPREFGSSGFRGRVTYSLERTIGDAPSTDPIQFMVWEDRYLVRESSWVRFPTIVNTGHETFVYPNIKIIGPDLNVGDDPEASRCQISVHPAIWDGSAFTTDPTFTRVFENVYNDKTGSTELLRYPSDGIDYTGTNPCVVYLRAQDIGLQTTGNIVAAHNTYQIRIKNLSAGQTTRVASVDVYDEGLFNPAWYFDTTKNIMALDITESVDDTRNDVIVVGDKVGAFANAITDEVVNPNNPSLQYIYSRAVDISSINDPASRNNIGRKKPFLIYEPGLVDQKHADWLAYEVLRRYHAFRQTPNWKSWGMPFIEIGDNVHVADRYDGLESSASSLNYGQWLISLSEKITTASYEMSMQTTPYEPWASFIPNPQPDINDFGGLPFIDIRMTDSAGNIRNTGYQYDVYEAETGNRLMVKYNQVIDGDVVVKVMSRIVLGQVYSRPVAYLVGGIDSNGYEKPEYREWGKNYTLFWDGIDQFGDSRRRLGYQTSTGGDDLIATLRDVDFVAQYDQPGFYAPSGEYFLRFVIYPRGNTGASITIDTTNLDPEFNDTIFDILYPGESAQIYKQAWNMYWGDLPELFMTVSGQRPGETARDITYGDKVFYSDEYDGSGVYFKFYFDSSVSQNKAIYYKVNIDHYWAVGYTFTLRDDQIFFEHLYNPGNLADDWRQAYHAFGLYSYFAKHHGTLGLEGGEGIGSEWGAKAYLNGDFPIGEGDGTLLAFLRNGPYLPGASDTVGAIKTYSFRGYRQYDDGLWNQYIKSEYAPDHVMDIDYYAYVEPDYDNDINQYRVMAWKQVPYTHYTVDDYIEQTKHNYSAEHPIEFYFNPTSPRAGGWTFGGLPDMDSGQLQALLDQLPMAAFYAGFENVNDVNKRLTFITNHTFQVNVFIWDNTGRIVKGDTQAISQGSVEHNHGAWGQGYTNQGNHTHTSNDTISMQPKNWRYRMNNGEMHLKNMFLDMRTPDQTLPNWGVGYHNVSGLGGRYGYWTWHGCWHDDNYTPIGASLGGFAQTDFDNGPVDGTAHWINYELINPDTTVLPSWTDSTFSKEIDLTDPNSHGHFPDYEGQQYNANSSNHYDPNGIMATMAADNDWPTEEQNGNLRMSFTPIHAQWYIDVLSAVFSPSNQFRWFAMTDIEIPRIGLPDQFKPHKHWSSCLWATGIDGDGHPLTGYVPAYGGWSHLSKNDNDDI